MHPLLWTLAAFGCALYLTLTVANAKHALRSLQALVDADRR